MTFWAFQYEQTKMTLSASENPTIHRKPMFGDGEGEAVTR